MFLWRSLIKYRKSVREESAFCNICVGRIGSKKDPFQMIFDITERKDLINAYTRPEILWNIKTSRNHSKAISSNRFADSVGNDNQRMKGN